MRAIRAGARIVGSGENGEPAARARVADAAFDLPLRFGRGLRARGQVAHPKLRVTRELVAKWSGSFGAGCQKRFENLGFDLAPVGQAGGGILQSDEQVARPARVAGPEPVFADHRIALDICRDA
jgi:hypothetical protein